MSQDSQRQGLDRVPVAEAARRLGLTPDAVRKRLTRGSLHYDRDQDGLIHVYIPSSAGDQDAANTEQESGQDSGQELYVRALEDQIRFLRQELERKDAILLRLAERVPELEPAEQREPSETPAQNSAAASERVQPQPDDTSDSRSAHEPESRVGRWLRGWMRGRGS